ncbi:MAG: efflux transporter outer membrane subunit [Rikenellaceae bacterium]
MRKIAIITAPLLLFTALSSCNLYKTYKTPEIEEVENIYRISSALDDTTSIASLGYKELFTDSELQKLIDEGLESNSDIQIALLQIEQAQASLYAARLSYLPSLSAGASASTSSFDGAKASNNYSLSLSAAWEIDIFGKKWNAKEKAIAAVDESYAYKQAVRSRLIATIAESYYTLLMYDKQLEISKANLVIREENLRVLRALKLNSTTTDAAIAQAEASKIKVEASLLTLQKQISTVENSLSTLLGSVASSIERGSLDIQNFPSEISYGLPITMLRTRADIKIAEYNYAQAHYTTNEARANFYPSISLSGSAGWTNSSGGVVADPMALLLSAAASLTQPIFNKGTNTANLKISEAAQEAAAVEFRQTVLEAGAEVNDALIQWQTAKSRLELSSKEIASQQRALHATELLMKHGSTNYLEVLVAQQSLLDAQLTSVSDKYDEISGVINLYYSLGGGN